MITVAQGITDPKTAGIISTQYSKKLNLLNWPKDLLANITSSAYFDEANKGDTVVIPVQPIVTINTHVDGGDIQRRHSVPSTQSIVIDQAWNWSEAFGPGMREFSYVDLLKTYSEAGMLSARKSVHESFFAWLSGKAAAENKGLTAGKKTQGFNLGTSAAPVKVTAATLLKHLLKFTGVFLEQNIDEEDIHIVLPAQLNWLVLQTELKSYLVTGEKSSLITGKIAKLAGRENFYTTNYVTGKGTHAEPFQIFAMTKQAVAYTNRLTKTDIWEAENHDLVSRGLGIWGRGIIKDWALAEMWIEIAEADAPSAGE